MPNYSLAEIDALARKATRGAGYSWGLAEEAGKAVRWLSTYGFLGAEALAKYLTIVANESQDFIPKLKVDGELASDTNTLEFVNANNQHESLCSIYSGTLINDLGHELNAGKTLSFDNMLFPLLALSQAGRVSEAYQVSIAFAYADTVIICNPNGIQLDANDNQSVNKSNDFADSNPAKSSFDENNKETPPLYENMLIDENLVDDLLVADPLSDDSMEEHYLPDEHLSDDTLIDSSLLEGSLLENSARVVCSLVENTEHNMQKNTLTPSPQSRRISLETYGILEQFAHATYAPNTAESRLRGAG